MSFRKNPLEWTVFSVGLFVLLALVAFLGIAAFEDRHGPAELRVTLGTPEAIPGGFRTLVRVENVGDEAAVAPKVKVDDLDLSFDYVPGHSVREGIVFTEGRPRRARPQSAQSP